MTVTFTQIPQNGSSYLKELLYEVEFSAAVEDVPVRILTLQGEELGRKQIAGSHTSISTDIAPYLRQSISHTPPTSPTASGLSNSNLHRDIIVEVGGVSCEVRRFIAADIDLTQRAVMLTTQLCYRVMDYDEFDTIGFVNIDANPLEVVIAAYDKSSLIGSQEFYSNTLLQQLSLHICPHDFGTKVKRITVSFSAGGTQLKSFEYEIRTNLNTSQRLCWLNGSLAEEFYTFPLRKSLLIEATRKRMATMWGREAAALEGDEELKIISAYEPREQIVALAKILSSPRVWLLGREQPMAVELYTDRVLATPGEGMGFIELDLRAAEKGVALW